ncbi:MAG TPA: hypothetical protein VFX98_12305 [Longimicrobiaceae bacterium]|nr:hypothetical protein [Longimicrobiaceae bacterium]
MIVRLAFILLALCCARTATAQGWTAVDVGAGHTCALDAEGRAFCWGNNHRGELGARTPETCGHAHHPGQNPCYPSPSRTPLAVQGGLRFASVSAGVNRTCGLDAGGRAFCWGKDIGSRDSACAGGDVCSFAPLPWAAGTTFRQLRAAEDAICGVTSAGEGRCWRRVWNRPGLWVKEVIFPGERLAWLDRYADWMNTEDHVTCAATEDGRAFCQGPNDFAQLGAGDTVTHRGPVPVAGGGRYSQVRPWAMSACGLTVEGEARCWGAAEPRERWPEGSPSRPEFFDCGYSAWCSTPRPVAAGLRFRALTHTRDRFCGVTREGEARCWTWDGDARPVAPGLRFQALDASETHACGLTAGGEVWCWGQGVDEAGDVNRRVRAPAPPTASRPSPP